MPSDGTSPELDAYQCDCDEFGSAVSPGAYLAALLDYATEHLQMADEPVTLDLLENTFFHRYGDLTATGDAATERVQHVRLGVESLLGYHGNKGYPNDIPNREQLTEYTHTAYETLLDEWGTSRTELHEAAYDDATREAVAETVGIAPEHVDELRLDPKAAPGDDDALTEETLEDRFGLRALVDRRGDEPAVADPLRTIDEPFLRSWRREYLRQRWADRDYASDPYPIHVGPNTTGTIDDLHSLPIIDPDLVGPDDFRPAGDSVSGSRRHTARPASSTVVDLWTARRKWVDGELQSAWEKTPAGASDDGDVPGLLDGMLSAVQYDRHGSPHDAAWYPSLSGTVPELVAASTANGAGPLSGRGFLTDFADLYAMLEAEHDVAQAAQQHRRTTGYATAPSNQNPAEEAREVIEDALHLSPDAFRRLVALLRKHFSDDKSLSDDAWWTAASILVSARKRSLAVEWGTEEVAAGIHFDGKAFWNSQREPVEGEWSYRLDQHAESQPFIDPERMERSDLPESGATASDYFESRQEALAAKRTALVETYHDTRAVLDDLVARYEDEREQVAGSTDATVSALDAVLSAVYPSVSTPWESHLSEIETGLATTDDPNSSTDAHDRAERDLAALGLSESAFGQLVALREKAKPTTAGEISDAELTEILVFLPVENPLDAVLTEVYQSSTEAPVSDVYDPNAAVTWASLFTDVTNALDDGSDPAALAALDMSVDSFETVAGLRARSMPPVNGSPSQAVLDEAVRTLTSVWKRIDRYDDWVTDEQNAGVTDYWDAYKARLPQWRASHDERLRWRRALAARSSPPVIDPDRFVGVDAFTSPAHQQPGFDLWTSRKQFVFETAETDIASPVAGLRDAAASGSPLSQADARTKLDEALVGVVGIDITGLAELRTAIVSGENRAWRLDQLDLPLSALTYVTNIASALGSRPITVDEWENVLNIVVGVWKRRQYGRWRREEQAAGVLLAPGQFDLPEADRTVEPPADDDPTRWRVAWEQWVDWVDALDRRTSQFDAVDESVADAVTAAEREALPLLRRFLVEDASLIFTREYPYDTKVEHLSERLLIDLEMTANYETTRVSQAITSLQTLLSELYRGVPDGYDVFGEDHVRQGHGLTGLDLEIVDSAFDESWTWLGSYPSWRSAMGTYLYPQNVLLPSMRRVTTAGFDRLITALDGTRDLTVGNVFSGVESFLEYYTDVCRMEPQAAVVAPYAQISDVEKPHLEGTAVPYAFGTGVETGNIYVRTFETFSELFAEQPVSTWEPVESKKKELDSVVGAAYYDDSIYLFVFTADETFGYLTFDTADASWGSFEGLKKPKNTETVQDAVVVQIDGSDRPPEVWLDCEMKDGQPEKFLVQFRESGEPPKQDEYVDVNISGGDLLGACHLEHDDGRTVRLGFTAWSDEVSMHLLYDTWEQNLDKTGYDLPRSGDDINAVRDIEFPQSYELSRSKLSVVVAHDNNEVLLSTSNQQKRISVWGGTPPSNEPSRIPDYLSGTNNPYVWPVANGDPGELEGYYKLVQANNLGTWEHAFGDRIQEVVLAYECMSDQATEYRSTASIEPVFLTDSFRNSIQLGALTPVDGRVDEEEDIWKLGFGPDDVSMPRVDTDDYNSGHTESLLDGNWEYNQLYLREAYFDVPLFVARRLTETGQFEAALEWFDLIYDSEGRDKNWYGLIREEGDAAAELAPTADWLHDPINPHSIASTRPEAYTRFTLFSLAQCLLDYADAEFAHDTARSVANARTLYERALDILERPPFASGDDLCEELATRLESAIESHVFLPALWEDLPELSEAEVRSRIEELKRGVASVSDYTDTKALVDTIVGHLERGEFYAALDAANAAEEQEPATYRERQTVDLASVYDELLGDPIISDRITRVGRQLELLSLADSDSELTLESAFDEGLLPAPVRKRFSSGNSAGETTTNVGDWSLSVDNLDLVNLDWLPTDGSDSTSSGEPTTDGGTVSTAVSSASVDILAATAHQFCVPKNPVLSALRQHGRLNLDKLRSGRNIAGMKRDLAPYAASTDVASAVPGLGELGGGGAGSVAQPTNYRYDVLIERAKELADRARQIESAYFSALEKIDREEYNLLNARQQLELSEERVQLHEVRLTRAQERVELAHLQQQKAVMRQQTYDRWLSNPVFRGERQAMDALRTAQMLQYLAAGFHGGAAVSMFSAAAVQTIAASTMMASGVMAAQGIAQTGAAIASIGSGFSSLAAASSTTAAAYTTQSQMFQLQARVQRRTREWKFQRRLAEQNVAIGDQRITIARDTVDVVEQERDIAELRADHAEDVVSFHENKFTNRELYIWMSGELERVYRYFLQQAASIAQLAQNQLAFERQRLPREFVQTDYWDAPTDGVAPSPGDESVDRRGLTGSARLLQDLYELDQFEFQTDERKLQVEKTLSLAATDPMALQRFRETGVLSFATTLEQFDVDHPGHYLRLIRDVDVTIHALTPPREGINATLRSSGTSRVVVGPPLFRERTISRDPQEVVLNRARTEEQPIQLTPQSDELLRPFEQSGVATDWELRMPKAANNFDYSTIVDVEFTVDYTALSSYQYRREVEGALPSDRVAERSFSFQSDFADAWYELNNPGDTSATTVTFTIDEGDFPSTMTDVALEGLRLYLVGPTSEAGRDRLRDLRVSLAKGEHPPSTERPTASVVDFGTAVSGRPPAGEWTLTVELPDGRNPFVDDTVTDVLLFTVVEGEVPAWPQ